jgi:hypothetical protein
MIIDKHTVALVSIIGSSVDVLGAMYLAYDLLGGEHGPLRTLTRAVTYGVLIGVGYGLGMGPVFGVSTGVVHGFTLGWEFSRASRQELKQGYWLDTAMSAIRGCGFVFGGSYLFGARFGITFGLLSAASQVIAYQFGIRPTVDYKPAARLHVTRFQLLTAVNRTVGYALTGYISSLVAKQPEHAIAVGLRMGLTIGLVTAVAGACIPLVEWIADHMREKTMGVFGVCLIIVGFALQSVQYWLALLDVSVR